MQLILIVRFSKLRDFETGSYFFGPCLPNEVADTNMRNLNIVFSFVRTHIMFWLQHIKNGRLFILRTFFVIVPRQH